MFYLCLYDLFEVKKFASLYLNFQVQCYYSYKCKLVLLEVKEMLIKSYRRY